LYDYRHHVRLADTALAKGCDEVCKRKLICDIVTYDPDNKTKCDAMVQKYDTLKSSAEIYMSEIYREEAQENIKNKDVDLQSVDENKFGEHDVKNSVNIPGVSAVKEAIDFVGEPRVIRQQKIESAEKRGSVEVEVNAEKSNVGNSKKKGVQTEKNFSNDFKTKVDKIKEDTKGINIDVEKNVEVQVGMDSNKEKTDKDFEKSVDIQGSLAGGGDNVPTEEKNLDVHKGALSQNGKTEAGVEQTGHIQGGLGVTVDTKQVDKEEIIEAKEHLISNDTGAKTDAKLTLVDKLENLRPESVKTINISKANDSETELEKDMNIKVDLDAHKDRKDIELGENTHASIGKVIETNVEKTDNVGGDLGVDSNIHINAEKNADGLEIVSSNGSNTETEIKNVGEIQTGLGATGDNLKVESNKAIGVAESVSLNKNNEASEVKKEVDLQGAVGGTVGDKDTEGSKTIYVQGLTQEPKIEKTVEVQIDLVAKGDKAAISTANAAKTIEVEGNFTARNSTDEANINKTLDINFGLEKQVDKVQAGVEKSVEVQGGLDIQASIGEKEREEITESPESNTFHPDAETISMEGTTISAKLMEFAKSKAHVKEGLQMGAILGTEDKLARK
jgi:hypothetical protein